MAALLAQHLKLGEDERVPLAPIARQERRSVRGAIVGHAMLATELPYEHGVGHPAVSA